jgi:1-acyl-sn-glycerol-3-phosphate acyltransferase
VSVRPSLAGAPAPVDLAPRLLEVVQQAVAELHPRQAARMPCTLDSSLERDLAFDSLGRVELIARIERAFSVILPDETLESAHTPRDLLAALLSAKGPGAALMPATTGAAAAQPSVGAPSEAATLLEVLAWHRAVHPERIQLIHRSDEGEQAVSYGALHGMAAAVAAGLQERGLQPRQTVGLMLPTCLDYFYAYYGILLAGGVPVPIYPPARLSQIEEHVRRYAGVLANAQTGMLITVAAAKPVARLLEAQVPGLRQVVTVAELTRGRDQPSSVAVGAEDIAFIQYTSGSTGNPKGVVLTHANLLANIRAIGQAIAVRSQDVFVSWLPLYHDMGLISAWLASLYFGNPLVVMSPLAFLARPERWLWAIHQYRGTLTAAPNFAYELCVSRIQDAQIAGLDLSCVRLAANGAEPVSPDTLERFQARFARYGLRPETLTPVYGLAESTVGLLVPPLDRGPLIDRIERQAFARESRARPAGPEEPSPLRFVTCGRPLPGHEIRIVDETGREVGERVEGRLEFKGPSATRGYYRNPEQSARLFHGEWLDTGDRAYLAQGEVYITGRVKDIVIRGGRKIYPQEVEEAVGGVPGVRKGCVAVFGSPDPRTGTERLVVLAETREAEAGARDTLREAIARTTMDLLGEPPDEVVLAPPRTVLKTSSGKIRRSASRELYEAGLIGARPRSVWWQMARLTASSAASRARRWAALAGEALWGARAWTLFWVLAPLTWLATAALARPAWAWAVARAAARLFFRLSGAPFSVRGLEHLPRGEPCILVANHASYLDGPVLLAALPAPFSFVAKRELLDGFITRVYLRRMGAQFVERAAAAASAEDVRRMTEAVAGGKSLIFFPEGTFRRAPGLLPFHLGAFLVAAQSGAALLPVTIRGARAMLRDESYFPRRSELAVTSGAPLAPPAPGGDPLAAAVVLRDAARTKILRGCGEPDAERG